MASYKGFTQSEKTSEKNLNLKLREFLISEHEMSKNDSLQIQSKQ